MKYYSCKEFDETGIVKTAYVPKDIARWRIYSYDVIRDDMKYFKDLASDFGVEPKDMVRIPQGHTNNIRVVTKDIAGEGVVRMEIEGNYDGAITNEKNIMLCTIEADCTPVFIFDVKNKAIGMVHSGWRGTVGEISINAIKLMKENYGTNVNDIMIHFGPSICGNCYEVSNDLIPEFKKILNDDELNKVFKPINEKKGKYLLDVTESIKYTLLHIGVKNENMTKANYCTYHSGIFSSWRLSQDRTNQMLTAIMIKETLIN